VRRGQAHLARLLPAEDFLLQRFEPGVLAEGERSLFFADGAFTHAVEKRAAPGDWRVQDDFGGVARRVRPAVDEHDVALGALAALPAPALYARVDLLRDGTGGPRVIEVELIEPAHFFEECPGAAEPYADAIARRLA
jgi:glutathione synthase/RimK-type ligase-like ATP-grasp enzyme